MNTIFKKVVALIFWAMVVPGIATAQSMPVATSVQSTSCHCARGFYLVIGDPTVDAHHRITGTVGKKVVSIALHQALPQRWHLALSDAIKLTIPLSIKPGLLWTRWLQQQARQQHWAIVVVYPLRAVYVNPLVAVKNRH